MAGLDHILSGTALMYRLFQCSTATLMPTTVCKYVNACYIGINIWSSFLHFQEVYAYRFPNQKVMLWQCYGVILTISHTVSWIIVNDGLQKVAEWNH